MRKKYWKRSAPRQNWEPETAEPDSFRSQAGWKLLSSSFFNAPPEWVARALLGKLLVRHGAGRQPMAGRIVETEAYLGEQDPAAHASSGRTARNAVLFGPPGYAYVYHIYGIHQCLNVSCLPDGTAGCVLLRALEPLAGIDAMKRNRGLDVSAGIHKIASGPGKLCQALGITRAGENGVDYTCADSPLNFYEDGFQCDGITVASRVGIRKAADLPLRFFLTGHACVSARPR